MSSAASRWCSLEALRRERRPGFRYYTRRPPGPSTSSSRPSSPSATSMSGRPSCNTAAAGRIRRHGLRLHPEVRLLQPYSGSSVCGNALREPALPLPCQNSYGYLPSLFYAYCGEFARLRKVTVQMETRQLGGTPSVVAPAGILVDCENAAEYDYGDIAVTLPKVKRSIPTATSETHGRERKLAGATSRRWTASRTRRNHRRRDAEQRKLLLNYQNTDNGANYAAVRLNFGPTTAWRRRLGAGHRPKPDRHTPWHCAHFTGAYLKSCTGGCCVRARRPATSRASRPGIRLRGQASSGSTVESAR